MTRKSQFLIFIVVAMIAATVLFVAGSLAIKDYHVQLMNGYSLFKADTEGITICSPKGEVLIGATVTLVGVADHCIVGRVTVPLDLFYQTNLADDPGYFIVDSATGTVQKGLSESACRQFFESSGMKMPNLVHPDRWRFTHPFN